MKFGTEGGGGLFDSLISGLLKSSVDKITQKVNEVQNNVIGSSGNSNNNFAASVNTENTVEQGSESDAETNAAEESESVSDSEVPSPEGTSDEENQVEENQVEESQVEESQVEENQFEETPVEEAQAEDQPSEEEEQESSETPSELQPEEESQESEPAESEPLTEAASAEGEEEPEETSSEEEQEQATSEGEPAATTDESSNSDTQIEAEVAAAPDSLEGDQTEQIPTGEESGEPAEANSGEEEEDVSPAMGNLPLNLSGNLRNLIPTPDARAKGIVDKRHVPDIQHAPDTHHPPDTQHIQDAAGHSNVLDLEALKKQLMRHEGYRKTRYFDSLKIPTIGIGFNLTKTGGRQRIEALGLNYDQVVAGTLSLSDAQIQQLFMDDVKSSISDVQRALTPAAYAHLSSVRKLVVVDMMFNMGIGTFSKFHNMIAALQAGDWKTTADHMQQSLWYKQVQGRGVELVAMMRSDAIPQAAATASA